MLFSITLSCYVLYAQTNEIVIHSVYILYIYSDLCVFVFGKLSITI